MKKTFLTALLLVIVSQLYRAQTARAAHWYFGIRAGLNFSSGSAVADTTGNLMSIEASASISDLSGNLLFYSNGEKIWNRTGGLMPNANAITGDQSSAQGCVAVPKPGNASIYYLFTTNAITGISGLYYNEVDMTLASGLGDVTASGKNQKLRSFCTEELAATKHCNGTDYWVVCRQSIQDTLRLFAYLVTSSGVAGTPVVSNILSTTSAGDMVGGLTFSPDGSLLVHASRLSSAILLMSFNGQTGQISLQNSIPKLANEWIYSHALSADASKLYTVSWRMGNDNFLSQFDLNAGNIAASRLKLDSLDFSNGSSNGYGFMGQIRLAPDQKLYISRWNTLPPYINGNFGYGYSLDSLDVVHAPNTAGTACNYQRNSFYLQQKATQLSLPNFVSNFVLPASNTNTTVACRIITGIPETKQQTSLTLSPNPFSDQTHIELQQQAAGNLSFRLNDLLGRDYEVMLTKKTNGYTMSRSNLQAGIYQLSIWNGTQLLGQQKLVITD